MTITVITGGTGQLGIPTVELLKKEGQEVKIISRREGNGLYTADLNTGVGLPESLQGADNIIHMVSTFKKGDTAAKGDIAVTERLLNEAKKAGVKHFVFISIIGVDKIPFSYYETKLAIEKIIEQSGVPYTILRIAQFHSFVEQFLDMQKKLPVVITPTVGFQPIDVKDAAKLIVKYTNLPPKNEIITIAGPEALKFKDFARQWQDFNKTKKPQIPIWLPIKPLPGFAKGYNQDPNNPQGEITFKDYLASK